MKRITVCFLVLWLSPVSWILAQNSNESYRIYTEAHPLVYEDAWDLWPYAFLNENNDPTGHNIDLLKMLFKELDIPYIIKLKDTKEALNDLKEGKADLMMGMDANFHTDYGKYGKTVLQLFTHSIVHVKGKESPVHNLADLANHKVIVHEGSFSHHLMVDSGWGANAIPYYDMKEAVQKVNTERSGDIIWNTMSLKWLIREYQADNLTLAPINIPHGEYKFMSNDPHLLEMLDSAYATLRSQDKLQPIQNKWLYPERTETGIPSWIWNVTAILIVVIIVMLIYYLFFRYRERRVTRDIRRNNARLALALQASGVDIWIYDIKQQSIAMLDNSGNIHRKYTLLEFSNDLRPKDFKRLNQALNQLVSQEEESMTLDVKTQGESNNEIRIYNVSLSVLHRDRDGVPTVIIGTRCNISEERKRQSQAKDTMLRYQAIFNTAATDMAYFDPDGIMTQLNDKTCETFQCLRDDILSRRVSVYDFYQLSPNDLHLDKDDCFFATITITIAGYKDILYELKLLPVHDSKQQLLGIYATGHEVSETSRNYQLRQESMRRLNQANKEAKHYIENINYVLRVGGMRFVSYNPDTHLMTIYSDINTIQTQLTQTRAIHLISEDSRKTTQRALKNMDNHTKLPINITIKTILRQYQGRTLSLQINLLPIDNEQGKLKEYYGICRDVSELKTAEEQLEQETAKAQEIETIKNAFLRNMNYEIRTPLNSIVGFAEFFQRPHSVEDEVIFANEIKNNASSLLKLINNILFLSRLDAHMIDIKTKPTDFSVVFESTCQTSWGLHAGTGKPQVNFKIENPYDKLVIDIDSQHIEFLIDQIISNAAHFTGHGTVLARYDYTGDQLVIAIEDTGCGIDSERLAHIFDRFSTGASNGTGLGLSICHELAIQMGGTINIKSVKGKGTTVWFAIPCKADEIERKRQQNNL